MKRTLKVISILLLTGVLALLLFACGESFTYRYTENTSGGFTKEYILKYDATASDAEFVKTNAVATMENFISSYGYEGYAKVYSDTEGEVSLVISFPTATDYEIWIGNNGREEHTVAETEKYGLLVYRDETIENYLNARNIALVRAVATEEAKDFPLAGDFFFVYATPYRSVTSNGKVTKENGVYCHEWTVTPYGDADIKMRRFGLNGILVYLIAVSIFVLSLAAIFVIIYVEKRKSRARFNRLAESAATHIDRVGRDHPDDEE